MTADILAAIDAATRLCPCGAEKADGSAYCSDDCRPTHIARDTDTSEHGRYATPARWRPDLPDDEVPPSVGEYWYWRSPDGGLRCESGAWMAAQRPVAAGQLLQADDVRPIGPRVTSASVTVHLDDGSTVTYDLHEGGDLEIEAGFERESDDEIGGFGPREPVRLLPSRYRLEVRGRYPAGVDRQITLTRHEPEQRHPGGVAPER